MLGSIRNAVARCDRTIAVRGTVRGTKTAPESVDLTLLRLADVEALGMAGFAARVEGGWTALVERYRAADPTIGDVPRPANFVVRLLAGTSNTYSGRNVFLFMPFAAMVADERAAPEEFFSLEFLDVFEAVHAELLVPAMQRLFDESTQAWFFGMVPPGIEVARVRVQMTSLHEIGRDQGSDRGVSDL